MAQYNMFDPQGRNKVDGPIKKSIRNIPPIAPSLDGAGSGYAPYKDFKAEIEKRKDSLRDIAASVKFTDEYYLVGRSGEENIDADQPKIYFYEARRRNDPSSIDWIIAPHYIESFTKLSSYHRQGADALYGYYSGEAAASFGVWATNKISSLFGEDTSSSAGVLKSVRGNYVKAWDNAVCDPNWWMAVIGGFAGGGAATGMKAAKSKPSLSPNGQSSGKNRVVSSNNLDDVQSDIKERIRRNKILMSSDRFDEDLKKVGVTKKQIDSMFKKELPLGFESKQQFKDFKVSLDQALKGAGLDDADIGLKGTATTFYSENPGKKLGHHWDANPLELGDYDLNLTSEKMVKRMNSLNIPIKEKYGIFGTSDINQTFKELDLFQKRWTEILGRDVNFVGYPSSQSRDLTEYVLRSAK